ncbi:MAG: hypothetical protein AB7I22_16625 [Ramlibacter sp.]
MITCYLDSQDYSSLTDPQKLTPELIALKRSLFEMADSGKVQFVFSAAAVCESVALTPEANFLAELKADFLSELCGRNALVSFDRLLKLEVTSLAARVGPPQSMLDLSGTWFPDFTDSDSVSESPWVRMRSLAEADLKKIGMSRQQRRALVRHSIKNDKPRGSFKQHIEQQSTSSLAAELVKQMPMLPEYAEMMVRWGLGQAGEEEFNRALMNSLRDPRWMMKWFSSQKAVASPVADIVRKPGRELGAVMRQLVEISVRWAGLMESIDPNSDPVGRNGEMSRKWTEMEEGQLVSLAERAAAGYQIPLVGGVSAADVDKFCPGISSCIRSLFSSVWTNIGGGRKEQPSDSQPVDALHAMYAPYVDVFRADRFMSPHIQKQVERHRTLVVSRLPQLISGLNTKLAL